MGRKTLEEQYSAEEAVVRAALDSTWNAYGSDTVADGVCAVAACGLDQGIISTVASWDRDGVFNANAAVDNELDRASAIIAAIRRVVDKEVLDGGALREVPAARTHTRYSLGVTFREGRHLSDEFA